MQRLRHRPDGNQGAIVDALRARGWKVKSLSAVGDGFPDLLAWRASDGFRLIEVKQPKGAVRKAQRACMDEGWPVTIARSVEDVVNL